VQKFVGVRTRANVGPCRVRRACLKVFDVLESDRTGGLAIGSSGNPYAVEAAASNRSLLATLEQTRASLKIERAARSALEAKLAAAQEASVARKE